MIRIHIDWEFMSPLLGIASGILEVRDMYQGRSTLLLQCRVKKEQGTTGYESVDRSKPGIPAKLFEELKPQIDIMVDSYFHGMLLEEMTYTWVDDSADDGWEAWAKKHDIDPKQINAISYSDQQT